MKSITDIALTKFEIKLVLERKRKSMYKIKRPFKKRAFYFTYSFIAFFTWIFRPCNNLNITEYKNALKNASTAMM